MKKKIPSKLTDIPLGGKNKHLTPYERQKISEYLKEDRTYEEMESLIGKPASTLWNEVSRNKGKELYDPVKAQKRAYDKQYQKKKTCVLVVTGGYQVEVERLLKEGLSPEQISGSKRRSDPSFPSAKAIYNFVRLHSLEHFLFCGEKKTKARQSKEYKRSKGRDTDKKYIDQRPEEVTKEDSEVDFIVCSMSLTVLLTVVNRHTKKTLIYRLPNRKKETINKYLALVCKLYSIKTITTDNDVAFHHWKEIEKELGITMYFTNPYHSWEKALIENCNRWIRVFVPKKADLSLVTQEQIDNALYFLNRRPKECLGWISANEFEKELGMIA